MHRVDTQRILRRLAVEFERCAEQRDVVARDLARRADRHFTYIGRIERGEQNVTVDKLLLEISAALEYPS